jgi:hypothetical protein
MKDAVFWDIKTQFVPRRKHYISATESSWLMLYKFEVFTAVTMKDAVFWNIKTQLVPNKKHITIPSLLMLYTILGFYGGDCKEFNLLGCYTVWLL